MIRFVILSTFVLFTGCAGSPAWHSIKMSSTASESKINNEKMMNLNIGQSKEDVLRIMGNPTRREAYQLENKRIIEFLFYRTIGWGSEDTGDKDSQFTPVAFENSKLIGWGRNFYDNVVKHAFDIRVK